MVEIVELHAIIKGHVQGVFFRATARDHAEALNLLGTVRNLADGTVEILAQGTKDQLDKLLQRVKEDPGMGRVDHIEARFSEPTRKLSPFRVDR